MDYRSPGLYFVIKIMNSTKSWTKVTWSQLQSNECEAKECTLPENVWLYGGLIK